MPHPVLSVAQMRQWEKATWASGVAQHDVIRRAGAAVARQAEALTQAGQWVLFLAGKGHNGDDAAIGSSLLTGRPVELLRLEDPENAQANLVPLLARRPALVVDGLFGIGLNRPLSPAWTSVFDLINEARLPVLAVDVPSGLEADSGRPFGTALRATVTLTLGAPKVGLLVPDAAPFVGRLEVASDIGLVPCPFATELSVIAAEDFRSFPPARPVAGHKGTFGHLAIIAGSRGYHGAAVLAARAAQRAQPGLITLLVTEDIYVPVAAQLQAVMVRPYSSSANLPESISAIVAGPGLAAAGPAVREQVLQLWQESPVPMVVDASALDWLPAGGGVTSPPTLRVITPHPGEAARLLGTDTARVQADRGATVRALARRCNECRVILKGHHTLIGTSTGPLWLNPTGNAHLAQGGSGDVLVGFLGGLLAQPGLGAAAVAPTALNFAVWRHGRAADRLLAARPGFVIEELIDGLACPRDAVFPSLPA